jgi:geranylgeranyl pyrophosphate synthase
MRAGGALEAGVYARVTAVLTLSDVWPTAPPRHCHSLTTTNSQHAIFLIAFSNRSDINEQQRRLAEITEMIHTASLVHDDVLDECSIRRGG